MRYVFCLIILLTPSFSIAKDLTISFSTKIPEDELVKEETNISEIDDSLLDKKFSLTGSLKEEIVETNKNLYYKFNLIEINSTVVKDQNGYNTLKMIIPYDIYENQRITLENKKSLISCPITKNKSVHTLTYLKKENNYFKYNLNKKDISSEIISNGYYILEEDLNNKKPILYKNTNEANDKDIQLAYFFEYFCLKISVELSHEILKNKTNEKIFNDWRNK